MTREATLKKCYTIRNRFYPPEVWPGVLHQRAIESFSSPDRTLLEIGCGRDAQRVRKIAPYFKQVVGLDLEISCCSRAGDRWNVLCADCHRIPLLSNSVDVITCEDVLEHLADPELCFREFARVLRPKGHLLIATVNKSFLPIIFGRLLPHWIRQRLNRLVSGTLEENTFRCYYRANTARELLQLASRTGFAPVWLRHVSHHPTYFMFSTLVYRAAVFFEQIIRRHDCLKSMRHFIHACFVLAPTRVDLEEWPEPAGDGTQVVVQQARRRDENVPVNQSS